MPLSKKAKLHTFKKMNILPKELKELFGFFKRRFFSLKAAQKILANALFLHKNE